MLSYHYQCVTLKGVHNNRECAHAQVLCLVRMTVEKGTHESKAGRGSYIERNREREGGGGNRERETERDVTASRKEETPLSKRCLVLPITYSAIINGSTYDAFQSISSISLKGDIILHLK